MVGKQDQDLNALLAKHCKNTGIPNFLSGYSAMALTTEGLPSGHICRAKNAQVLSKEHAMYENIGHYKL